MTARAAALSLLLCAATLAGCSRSYTVELLNATDSPIAAELRIKKINGDTLTQADIAPGGFASMGPVKSPLTESVELTAYRPGQDAELPARLRLSPGLNEVRVSDGAAWDRARLRFELLRLGDRRADDLPELSDFERDPAGVR